MDILIGNRKTAEDMNQSVHNDTSVQQRKSMEEVSEQKEMKTQCRTEKQIEESYDAVSAYGDTLSISKEGKTASSERGSNFTDKTIADGIVIRKETEENRSEQENEVSTVNLAEYTEFELKQMYLDGDITKSEYDEELSSREMQR